jgi:hypothetical protein
MSRAHSHTCSRCQRSFGCAGELIRNWDGYPEVICRLFHEDGESRPQFRQCDDCVMTSWCDDCGAQPMAVELDGDRLCLTCADARKAAV